MYDEYDEDVYWVPMAPRKRTSQRQQRRTNRRSCNEVAVFLFVLFFIGVYLRFG